MNDALLHGLCIRSPWALGPAPGPGTPLDLRLEILPAAPVPGTVPEGAPVLSLRAADRVVHAAAADDAGFVLRIPGLCEFLVDPDLARVRCRPDPRAVDEQLVLLVRGSLVAFVLGLGGSCALHAAAVEIGDGGEAVAVIGSSGMGKSTLAALACAGGARFVCDDLVRLGPGPTWVGSSAELRLRPAAAPVIAGRSWPTRRTVDGRLALRPPRTARAHGPLVAAVVPRPRRTGAPLALAPVEPVDAALLVSGFPRLAHWQAPQALEGHFLAVASLVDAVPVWFLDVPWGPPFPAGLPEALVEILRAAAAARTVPV